MKRRDGGQATAELALTLPVVALVVLAVVQVAVVARAHLLVVHAAREGARAAAVGDPASDAATGSTPLTSGRMSVAETPSGRDVRVEVQYRVPTDVPIVGALVGDVTVRAEATMRREGDPASQPAE